ncbi:MAG: hypothetical protein UY63_C0017G0043 [Parcubacteria group bacterium GW2011_GWA2_51_10]|nr:MAG: hypothetical protein UY63_C0017G0043 [Parcubacteria group bacterium GW2011_GWA2_51_10]
MDRWVPDHGPGNAVRIDQEGDPILVLGVGAGPVPTAKTMIADAKALCPLAPA